ncbi:hypothetical protein BJ875DRAFT_483630 [Amylocarpus encephaloides]|uniref:RING-type domain-containing protein n=1 Tax=Amylocarpus encephaloides TaxID=45428 RepID=A0A9P7YK44_9HELO|nr:hypothetical protein BJ875DRAFT_483630 [Amylocarpus encephaloides]
MVAAQLPTVLPSNLTLPTDEQAATTTMRLLGGPLFQAQSPFSIVPLTTGAGRGGNAGNARAVTFVGAVKMTDATNAVNITSSEIAFISCDGNTESNLTPSDVVMQAGSATPRGIVLYSTTANACNLTGNFNYETIYSMTKLEDTQQLLDVVGQYPPEINVLNAQVGSNSTTSTGVGSQTSNDGGPAPTTAVAMSILYSITGIITLLFLIIIATGAVRAHRHPERYGPRTGYSGRPRQSRAKGLARAMLETLPIVKFGDPEPVKPGNREVELGDGRTPEQGAASETTPPGAGTTTTEASKSVPASATAVTSGMGAAEGEHATDGSREGAAAAPVVEGELGCSICTEDFTTGEDVRVLPCNHKYHPACIDPWLLNVSGTCPLCRHDLRPDAGPSSPTTDGLAPPLNDDTATQGSNEAAEDAASNRQPHRRSRFLDLHRVRNAPADERIAALRRLREQSRADGAEGEAVPVGGTEDVDEQQSRRARLTSRLKDKFRIRTRPQNDTPPP